MPTATGRWRAALAALALLLAGGASAAEAVLTATVDRTAVALGELVTLNARLEAPEAPTRWEFPSTADFEVVAEQPSQEHSVSLGGGAGVQIRQVYGITRQLRPTRAGSLSIPAITAVVRGKSYRAPAIAVMVVAAGGPGAQAAPTAPPQDPAAGGAFAYHGWEKDLVLRAEVDRREAFVGEQLTVEFWLLSPLEVVRYQGGSVQLDGFWKEELETPRSLTYELRTVNGVPTRAYLIQRLALFPTRAGDLAVGPMELRDIGVRPGKPGLLPRKSEPARIDRSSAPVTVRVKGLPPNAPAGFEAANVGVLQLQAAATPARVAVGEPIAVRLRVSGDGNVRALSPPRVTAIPGTRAFPPTTQDALDPRRRLSGSRTVETVLVPEQTGELVIPPTDWPYFDPQAGRYQVARTPELKVEVVPAALAADPGAGPGTNALAPGLRPIRAQAALSRRGPPAWERGWFTALLLAPPLCFAAAAAAIRLGARGPGGRARRAQARSSRRLLTAGRRRLSRGDVVGALAEAERALVGYAAERLGRPVSGLTRTALAAELSLAGAHPPAVRAVLQALERIDAARYGGAEARADEVLGSAERALSALAEADWQAAAAPAEAT